MMMLNLLLLLLMNSVLLLAQGNDSDKGSILPEAISACPGEQLTLTCSTSNSSIEVLRWTVTAQDGNPMHPTNIPISGTYPRQSTPYSSNVTLYFSRISAANVYPFISEVTVDQVNADINQTLIQCRGVGTPEILVNSTVHVISNVDVMLPLEDLEKMEYHGANNVLVTLKMYRSDKVSYTVSVDPAVNIASMDYQLHTNRYLTLSYNTVYNVSIVATVCGRHAANKSIVLQYGKCRLQELPDPSQITSVQASQNSPTLTNEAIEGTIVSFSCSSGSKLSGLNSTMCTSNGEWDPDPTNTTCTQGSTNASEMSIAIVITNWLITGVLSAVLVAICILSSLTFFLVGYICHGVCHKATTHTEADVVSTEHAQTVAGTSPIYDELRLEHVTDHEAEMRGSNLQMNGNEAYGPWPLKSLNTH